MPILYNVGNKLTAGSEPPQLYRYQDRVLGDGGTLETRDEASTFIRRLRSAGVLGSTVIAGVAGGYKAGTLYSIIGPDLDVTRGTVANRINRAGSFASVASGVPATTYADGVLKGTYVRSSLQNLFRDSEPATDPGQGTRDDVTFAINDWGIGLDGKVVFGDNSVDRFYYNTGISTEGTYSAAFIIKPDNGIQPTFGVGGGDIADFRVGSSSSVLPYEVTPLGGGLFFVTVARSITTNFDRIGLRKQAAANNSIGFEASAIMVVAGSVNLTLEDYIKTTGSAQTRNADVITKTGLGSVLPDRQGWFLFDGSFLALPNTTVPVGMVISNASLAQRRFVIGINSDGLLRFTTRNDTGAQDVTLTPFSYTLGDRVKVLLRWDAGTADPQTSVSGGVQAFVNGQFITNATFRYAGQLNRLNFYGASGGGGFDTLTINKAIHSIAIGSGAITDASAIQLTTL
jgi:hypothetical protein